MGQNYIEREIRAVRKAINELVAGAQSATVSAGGATKSYTRATMTDLQSREAELFRQLSIRRLRRRVGADFS